MLYYFVYFLMLSYVLKVSKRTLHMLQQNIYNENNDYEMTDNTGFIIANHDSL